MPASRLTRSRAAEDRSIAIAVGGRIRSERKRQGLTQAALAGTRYTKAYISALENGLSKPSVAALSYIADRLACPWIACSSAMMRRGLDWRSTSGSPRATGKGPSTAIRLADLYLG